ncbi:MAG TPA: hypothetical protein VFE47_24185 [Tepidisphaeraceae bacterium]|nr:hypothetical protein [Tepidisphaeraceae bacterium]
MRGGILRIVASCVVGGMLAPVAAWAGDAFAGDFDGKTLSVHLVPKGGEYAGEIRKGDAVFPLSAYEKGDYLVGNFSTPDGKFEFYARLTDSGISLTSAGKDFPLTRHHAAPAAQAEAARAKNPLDAKPAVNAHGAGALKEYTAVNSSEFGKAFTVEKPGAASLTAAFQATFPDLAKYFDEKPVIGGAYEDATNHASGGASFTAKLDGKAVNGFVSCKLDARGAKVAVVYCVADAPRGAWAALLAKPAAGGAGAAIALREYQFPDNTGTVGVAEGYSTTSPSLMIGVVIKGPAGQEVNLAFGAAVNTPDGPLVQTYRQMVANARQWGMQPPPPLPVNTLIAPYSDPAAALKDLWPQFSRMSQAANGPALTLERILSVQKVNTMLPNGQAALIEFDFTKTAAGVSTHFRSGIRWDMGPTTPGGWMIYTAQVVAPVETYQRDFPAMLAMATSLKENPQVIMEKTRINIEAANARFAALQQANHELQAAFDAQHRSWEHNQLIQSRSFADFDETIIGYRTVVDTNTGDRHSIDLGNVHDVVNHLNEFQPGRFKELPLRDEMYPLNGR